MWVFGPGRVWKWSGGGFGFIWTKFQPKRTILGPFGSIFGTIYFSKSCWPRNLLPGDVVEIFISLIYEKLAFLGPTGPDGDPWRPKADFLEAEGRRRGVWGRSPQEKNHIEKNHAGHHPVACNAASRSSSAERISERSNSV